MKIANITATAEAARQFAQWAEYVCRDASQGNAPGFRVTDVFRPAKGYTEMERAAMRLKGLLRAFRTAAKREAR